MSNTLNSNDLPLASRLRPQSLAEFIGQSHLLGAWRLFSKMLEAKKLHSMILWGPPGVGKTTLANLLIRELNSETSKFNFQILSAINSGVKEIRALREKNTDQTKKMVLFIDEIHRFSKTQQDALLPLIESGEIYLIGATTENPSFELNKALLSRCRVHVLKPLSQEELKLILNQALLNKKNGFGNLDIDFSELEKDKLVVLARGDARNLLNLLEIILEELVAPDPKTKIYTIVMENLYKNLGEISLLFDKQGDFFYDVISALHKAIRGSDPDASLYWLAYLLVSGADPLYIARRLVRIASEDIGNADPRALQISLNAWDIYKKGLVLQKAS